MGVNGIYGLSGSGLDVESMVKAGMLSKQNEYDKMQQKYTAQQWKKEAFGSIYQDLNTYNYTTLSDYKLSSSTNAHKATSNNSAITATASSSAASMAHKVEISDMATNAYVISTKSVARANSMDEGGWKNTSIKLADVLFAKESFKQNIDDGTGTVTYSAKNNRGGNESVDSVSGKSGSDIAFTITINDGVTERTSDVASGTKTKDFTLSYTFEDLYNGKTFNDLVSDINSLGTNVRATYDSVNDQFSFYNKESGKDNKVGLSVVENGSYNTFSGRTASVFLNRIGLVQSKDGDLYGVASLSTTIATTDTNGNTVTSSPPDSTVKNVKMNVSSNGTFSFADGDTYSSSSTVTNDDGSVTTTTITAKPQPLNNWSFSVAGTDASVKVDGITYDNLSSNKISISGVTYEWTDKTTTGTSATVTVSQDTDKIVDKVKSFVESYNKLLAGLYEKYDEKTADGTYKPLTESQKEGMKDEQIEKWEKKAKQGLLYHDSTIGKIIDDMRSAISTPISGVNSKYNSAYSIGISTTGLKGQLTLDEDKLRKALAADEDAAYNVLSKLEYKTDAKTPKEKAQQAADNYAGSGLAQRLGDVMLKAISNVKDYAGTDGENYDDDSSLGTLMKSLKEKMDSFKTMMDAFEEKLYKRYDAMEVALASLGTQLSFITG